MTREPGSGAETGASPDPRIARWQIRLALLGVAASVAFLLNAVYRDPDVPFLTGRGNPDWITVFSAVDRDAIPVDLHDLPVTTFTRHFSLDAAPEEARVSVRVVGEAELWINHVPVWTQESGANWKQTSELDATDALRVGDNQIRLSVANLRGPPLLQLRLTGRERGGDEETIAESDATWQAVGPRSRGLEVTRALDTRVDPQSVSIPSSGEVMASQAGVLALLFALGALGSLALRRSVSEATRARAPEAVLAAGTVFWVLVYSLRSTSLPVLMGFDIIGHLAYIDFLLAEHSIPLASDGGSMYHPPLGHTVIAGIVALFDLSIESAAARWLYRLPTFLAGLGNVWLVWLTARLLFRNDPLRTGLAVGFAALLPMNVYMSAYVSNEPMHSALVSLALWLACTLLVVPGASAGRLLGLAAALGLAILTKFTALVAVPLAAFFVAMKLWLVDRAQPLRAAAVGAGVLAGVGIVGGWFYVRNWILLGRPVVGNWDLPGRFTWWEQPGFHTADYYTSFGQALSHPYFAGYSSFWDGIYSTFWGDGLVAGMARLATRHDAWSYEFMTVGYWLAFPATLLLGAGFARALRFCLHDEEPGRRLAMSLLLAFLCAGAFALLAITFQLPYYAQAKAFYLLSAIVPLSLVAGLGLAWPLEKRSSGRWLPLQMIYCGWLTTLSGALVLAFLG